MASPLISPNAQLLRKDLSLQERLLQGYKKYLYPIMTGDFDWSEVANPGPQRLPKLTDSPQQLAAAMSHGGRERNAPDYVPTVEQQYTETKRLPSDRDALGSVLQGAFDFADPEGLKLASLILPTLFTQGSKRASKAAKILEKKFGVSSVEELVDIPYTRYQTERVPVPVSRGGRGGIFVTPEIGYSRVNPNLYYSPYVGVGGEGGNFKVTGKYSVKNPYFMDRDIHKYENESTEYIGNRLIRDLLGENEGNSVLETIHKEMGGVTDPPTRSFKQGEKIINRLFTPKERKTLYQLPAGNIAVEEAVANRLAQRSGYDSIVNLRRFAKEVTLSPAAEEYYAKKVERLRASNTHNRSKFGRVVLRKNDLEAKKRMQEKLRGLREFAGKAPAKQELMPGDIEWFVKNSGPEGLRLLDKAYRSKSRDNLTNTDILRLINLMGDLPQTVPSIRQLNKAANKLKDSKTTYGYNATQLVLLDPALQKAGMREFNRYQINELMNMSPEELKRLNKPTKPTVSSSFMADPYDDIGETGDYVDSFVGAPDDIPDANPEDYPDFDVDPENHADLYPGGLSVSSTPTIIKMKDLDSLTPDELESFGHDILLQKISNLQANSPEVLINGWTNLLKSLKNNPYSLKNLIQDLSALGASNAALLEQSSQYFNNPEMFKYWMDQGK